MPRGGGRGGARGGSRGGARGGGRGRGTGRGRGRGRSSGGSADRGGRGGEGTGRGRGRGGSTDRGGRGGSADRGRRGGRGGGRPAASYTWSRKRAVPGAGPDGGDERAPDAKRAKGEKEELATTCKKILDEAFRSQDVARHRSESDKVLGMVKGRLREIGMKHDTSRIIQTILKFGSPSSKKAVVEELEPFALELARGRYTWFLVNKLMKYAPDAEIKSKIVGRLLGNVQDLLKHEFGSKVVEEAFQLRATPLERCTMVEEFYGAEFKAFKPDKKRTLREVLKEAGEAKGKAMMAHLKKVIASLLNKQHVPDCTLFHHLVAAWSQECSEADGAEVASLLAEHAVRLAHTREGARVAVWTTALCSAKERKVMIKSLRGAVPTAAADQWGHLFVISLLERTDDTALLVAGILTPLVEEGLRQLLTDKYAHVVFLNILSPRDLRFFDPITISLLKVNEASSATSKKDPEVRRRELMEYLAEPLAKACKKETEDMVASPHGSRVLLEVLRSDLVAQEAKNELVEAVWECAASSEVTGDAVGNRTVQKALTIVEGSWRGLLEAAGWDKLREWAVDKRKAFIVAAAIKSAPEDERAAMIKQLDEVMKEVRESKQAGPKNLADVVDGKSTTSSTEEDKKEAQKQNKEVQEESKDEADEQTSE